MDDPARFIDAHVTRTGPLELVHEQPWSTVWRCPTTGGTVWLKAAAPGAAFEAAVYELLSEVAPDAVLVPLALDVERGVMLLPDGGPPVGDDGLAAAMGAYARLQRAVAPHVERLLALGVADMRPAVLPERFEEALGAVEPVADARTFARLAALRPSVEEWASQLASSPGAPTLDHNDLHAQNVLAGPRFFDWGDSVVGHPFASLLVPGVHAAYLDAFADLAPRAELEATAELAIRLGRIARSLVWQRIVDMAGDGQFADAPFRWLATLLD